ncbi:TPA: hypothetical protein VCL27_000983 [Streptococcus pyogenes]|nr:hypothetical protein [Streptococcus pyogenes]
MKNKKEQWTPKVHCFRKDGSQCEPENITVPISFAGYYQILLELGEQHEIIRFYFCKTKKTGTD